MFRGLGLKTSRDAGRIKGCIAAVVLLIAASPAAVAQMALPGTFAVNSLGAATYSIPVAVPPGTAGMTPTLSLDYNSQAGDGIMGVGWSLAGLPALGRCPRTMAQDGVVGGVNYDGNDRFCLDGQRLIAISGTYGADGTEYRTEVESYSRVISHGTAGTGPAWFEVHTKTGQIMEFGHTADSQVLALGRPTARAWALNKISDTKGNYLAVTYVNDPNGVAYPSRIDYTGNTAAGLAPYNSVRFVYSTSRPVLIPYFQGGTFFQIPVLLANVQTYAGSSLVGDYRLAYGQSAVIAASLLSSVTLCAGDGSCLPATAVTWTDGDHVQFASLVGWSTTGNYYNLYSAFADFNGDGKQDEISYYCDQTGWYVRTALSNGDGTFAAPVSWSASGNYLNLHVAIADVNGDGKQDLIAYYEWTDGWHGYIALSNGDGTFAGPISWNAPGNYYNLYTAFADFNGDGKQDLVAYYTDQTGWYVRTALSNGDGTFAAPVFWSVPGNYLNLIVAVADFNGDGKQDLIAYYADQTGWHGYVALSNGDGTFAAPVTWVASGNYYNWYTAFADVNGDGKQDLIVYYEWTDGWHGVVSLAKGDGTFTSPGAWNATDGNYYNLKVAFVDVNGDGKQDLVAYYTDQTGWYAHVALSYGNGSFAPPILWSLSGNWLNWNVAFADVNGDGKPDMIAYYLDQTGWHGQVALANSPAFPLVGTFTPGLGTATTVTYATLSLGGVYSKDNSAAYPIVDVQAPVHVVSRVDVANGIGGTYSTAYSYAGAKGDLSGRGFLGFRQMTSTDLQTNIAQTTTYRQDYPFIAQIASTTKYLGSTTLASTANTYGSTALGGTRYQVYLNQTQTSGADLDGSALPTTISTFTYDAFNNATQIAVSVSDGSGKTTANTFANDTTNWLLGRLTSSSATSVIP